MPNNLNEEKKNRILIVDDDASIRQSVARALQSEGFGDALLCGDPREAIGVIENNPISVILLDLIMPHISGEALLRNILAKHPEISVIVVTAMNEIDTAVRCIKAGAFDYIVKPVDLSRLAATVTRAQQQYLLRSENLRLRQLLSQPQLRHPEFFESIITKSQTMFGIFKYIEAIAPSSEPVLIVGETGVGKELVARAVHLASGRKGEFVAVNVAGIDENAFADTLFGHVKGAFTGAERDRKGLIERAAEGTLFLDEIGDLSIEMQTKLLRLVQEGEFFPLGTDRCLESHCRIIAATNRDLRIRVRENRFREDLFYRLHGHLIRVPPLRERINDVPLLVEYFLKEAARILNKQIPTVPKELAVHLMAYRFPGNIRELRAMIFDALARHEGGVLSLASFHEHMDREEKNAEPKGSLGTCDNGAFFFTGAEMPTLDQAEKALISEALKRTNGNQGAAARLLGVSRKTISRYLNSKNSKV